MKALFSTTLTTAVAVLALGLSAHAEGLPKHLFILSGQSNMHHLHTGDSFRPAVEAAFGKENVIIAKSAKRGAPLMAWDKDYQWPEGRPIPQGRKRPGRKETTREEFEQSFGQLYDKLLASVKKNIEGKNCDTVTFVWMQGETDAGKELSHLYEESFQRVLERLKADLGIGYSMNVVIGRLSDYREGGEWEKMRQLQVKMADKHANWGWVNTDDLNDMAEKDGSTKNDLHYTKEGYKVLGQRFADKAIELRKKQ